MFCTRLLGLTCPCDGRPRPRGPECSRPALMPAWKGVGNMNQRRITTGVLLAWAGWIAAGAACADDAESVDEANLYAPAGVSFFPPGSAIRVCWVTVTLPGETLPASGLQSTKDAFRDELKNSWERWANISFVGFNECPTSGHLPGSAALLQRLRISRAG